MIEEVVIDLFLFIDIFHIGPNVGFLGVPWEFLDA